MIGVLIESWGSVGYWVGGWINSAVHDLIVALEVENISVNLVCSKKIKCVR